MKIGFFENESGEKSITRVIFAFLILNATLMTWFMLLSDTSQWQAAAAMFGTVSSVATGLKLIQKAQESSERKNKKAE